MNSNWKKVLLFAGVFLVAFLVARPFFGGMMGYSGMHGGAYQMPYGRGGMMGGGMFLGWLVPAVIIGLVIFGVYTLGKRSAKPADAVQTPAPVAAPICPHCGKAIESTWVACPFCGEKTTSEKEQA